MHDAAGEHRMQYAGTQQFRLGNAQYIVRGHDEIGEHPDTRDPDAPHRRECHVLRDGVAQLRVWVFHRSVAGRVRRRQLESRHPITISNVPITVASVSDSSNMNAPRIAAHTKAVYSTGSSTCASARA